MLFLLSHGHQLSVVPSVLRKSPGIGTRHPCRPSNVIGGAECEEEQFRDFFRCILCINSPHGRLRKLCNLLQGMGVMCNGIQGTFSLIHVQISTALRDATPTMSSSGRVPGFGVPPLAPRRLHAPLSQAAELPRTRRRVVQLCRKAAEKHLG